MPTIRAYRVFEGGKFGTGRFTSMAVSDLDAGDVVIRPLFASVNRKDALAALGRAKIVNRFACTVGIDVCVEVSESGDPRFEPGDHVVAHGSGLGADHDGGYQDVNRFPAESLVSVPAPLTAFETAAIGVAGYAAALSVDLMELNGLRPGEGKVLVNGATGGVASIAIDLLSGRGYEVVARSGKPEAADYLRSLGAAEVIDRRAYEFGTRPLEKPLWRGAVDSVGGDQLGWLARSMQADGVIAAFGNSGGVDFKGSVLPFILRGVRLIGVFANSPMPLRKRIWQRPATDLKPRHLKRIARRSRFDDLLQAFNALIEAKAAGRMVVDFSLG